jgi:hypothetical protein
MFRPQGLLFLSCILLCTWIHQVSSTALDDYVWRKDDAYGWVDMVISIFNISL